MVLSLKHIERIPALQIRCAFYLFGETQEDEKFANFESILFHLKDGCLSLRKFYISIGVIEHVLYPVSATIEVS